MKSVREFFSHLNQEYNQQTDDMTGKYFDRPVMLILICFVSAFVISGYCIGWLVALGAVESSFTVRSVMVIVVLFSPIGFLFHGNLAKNAAQRLAIWTAD